jgi:hypothetical protein
MSDFFVEFSPFLRSVKLLSDRYWFYSAEAIGKRFMHIHKRSTATAVSVFGKGLMHKATTIRRHAGK